MDQAKPYRVLHTADWHLGKLLGDLSREEEHGHFLDFLLDEIVARDIDALLIAGDVFDSANPPQSAIAQYYNFLSRLHGQTNCQAVIIAGNHDSPAHIEAPRQVLQVLRTHVVGQWQDDPQLHLIPLPDADNPRVVIAAVPFLRDRDLRSGVSGQTPTEIQATLNAAITDIYQSIASAAGCNVPLIGMGHLTVVGANPSDSEREIHIGGLGALPAEHFPRAFAYIALGHLHRPQACGVHETIRYAGSPLPLSFSECQDQKEVRLLEITPDGRLSQTSLPVPLSRRLLRIRCDSGQLPSTFDALRRDRGADLLPAWVELTLTDTIISEGMHASLRELTRDAPFEVIRVLQAHTAPLAEIHSVNATDDSLIDSHLGQPETIFSMRLEQCPDLSAEQKSALQHQFQSLLALHRGE